MPTLQDTLYKLGVEIHRNTAFCEALHKQLTAVPLVISTLDMTANELTATAVILGALLADLETLLAPPATP